MCVAAALDTNCRGRAACHLATCRDLRDRAGHGDTCAAYKFRSLSALHPNRAGMPTKCLRTLGEIRLDVQQQRICLEDVLCFLTSTNAYSAVHQRFTKLAKDGALATLGVALARTPLHAFRGVGGSRTSTCSTRYIKDPNEFTEIIGELVRHYHSALGKGGRQQGKLAAFWPKVQDFHLNFRQTWPGLWDAVHCKATGIPLLVDVGLQYHELAPLLPTPSVSPKVRRSCLACYPC